MQRPQKWKMSYADVSAHSQEKVNYGRIIEKSKSMSEHDY